MPAIVPSGDRPQQAASAITGVLCQRTVSVADPLVPPILAVMVVVPALWPVATPPLSTDATIFEDEDQATALVRSLVVPSL